MVAVAQGDILLQLSWRLQPCASLQRREAGQGKGLTAAKAICVSALQRLDETRVATTWCEEIVATLGQAISLVGD